MVKVMDDLGKLNLKIIRDSPTIDEELLREELMRMFPGISPEVFYICDICDCKFDILEDMETRYCDICGKYYDYCKYHPTPDYCPLCK